MRKVIGFYTDKESRIRPITAPTGKRWRIRLPPTRIAPKTSVPIVKVSRGIFGNILTAPRAAVLGVEDGGKRVKVLWIDGLMAGEVETLDKEKEPLLAVQHIGDASIEEARALAQRNREIKELREIVAEKRKIASREDVVRYANELRKALKKEGYEIESHGFQEDFKDRLTVTVPHEEVTREDLQKVEDVLRKAGFKDDIRFFTIGRSAEVTFTRKDVEEAEKKLVEMQSKTGITYQKAKQLHKERSQMARRTDEALKAEHVISKDSSLGFDVWAEKPARWDIEGVDTPKKKQT